MELRQITPLVLSEFILELQQAGAGAATIRSCLGLLQSMFARAVEWDRASANVVKLIAKPRAPRVRAIKPLRPTVVEALRRQMLRNHDHGLRDATLVSVLAYAGLRPEEALAIELLLALADGDALLAIDHLGLMLSSLSDHDTREFLGDLRAARQRHPHLDLVLVEHPDGPSSRALEDSGHPLYHAGQRICIRRAKPSRFIDDLVITRPWTKARAELIGAAAELATGVPALTWRIIDLAPSRGEDDQARALAGWRRLRETSASLTAREWDLLRRVHPSAQPVVAAISVGLRPHAVAANPKSVNDVLARLRELGLAWQPQPRTWALADPLLAAWARDHAPPWARHRGG